MKTRHILMTGIASLALCAGFALTAFADNVADIKHSITDRSIIFPESFETNSDKLQENWYIKNYTATDSAYKSSPDVEVTDEVMAERLKALPTIIEMPFNNVVKEYILCYTKDGREQVAAILGLSNYYLPIFEQELESQGLPLELKYLPMVESALDPNAVSSTGAAGLWQFSLPTAKSLGMEVNSLVDERRDPYVSTQKAVGYLKSLYKTYGDWSMAIAAFNCGTGEVNKAIRRAGGEVGKKMDFWNIYEQLKPENRGYLPAFIAANYVMNYHNEHNIHPVLATKPLITDTVAVNARLGLNQVAEVLDIPVEELRILNPQFRADVIPGSASKQYFLTLPPQQVNAYLLSENAILATKLEEPAKQEVAERRQETRERRQESTAAASQPQTPDSNGVVTHKVKAGENIADIAKMYGVEPEQIKEWNNLRRNQVRTGQQLTIYPKGQKPAQTTRQVAQTQQPAAQQQATRQVQTQKPAQQQQTAQQTQKANQQYYQQQQARKQQQYQQQQYYQQQQKKKQQQQYYQQQQKKKQQQARKQQQQQKPTQVQARKGDSLERIARQNGVTVKELKAANPKYDGKVLHPGDKVTIPKKSAAAKKKSSQKQAQSSKTQSKKSSAKKSSAAKSSSKKTSTKKKKK